MVIFLPLLLTEQGMYLPKEKINFVNAYTIKLKKKDKNRATSYFSLFKHIKKTTIEPVYIKRPPSLFKRTVDKSPKKFLPLITVITLTSIKR